MAEKNVSKSKKNFLQTQIKSSELVLSKFGLFVGISKGRITVKEYGKLVKSLPIHSVTRIIILFQVNISSALIKECAVNKIDIDFIHNNSPYALLTYFKTTSYSLHYKQLDIANKLKGLGIAQEFIKAKSKNQINLVKYISRYRKDKEHEKYEVLIKLAEDMLSLHNKIKYTTSISELMGYEGVISSKYWQAFSIAIEDASYNRVTQNAPDPINQSLNYGYAILYNRIQSALIKSGLNIYYSFLHSPQDNKPTLVYDLIEEFRQAVVDREIIAIINRGSKLTTNKGKLDNKTIKLITQSIQKRLATPTKWRKGKYRIISIINEQATALANGIEKESRYKGFLVRY